MTKRMLRCAVILLLLLCMVLAIPAGAKVADETIYVSDLYYGYHTSYMSVPLGNYSIATTQIMADVYEDFINDPAFIWTKVSGSLTAVTSPKEMFKIVSDAFIETEFTYNSALTAANEKLALGLLQMTSNKTDLTGTASAIVDRVNAMGDLLSVIYKDCDLESLTDIEAVNKLFDHMINNKTMKALTSAQLEQVRTAILDDLQYIGNLTTAATSIIDLMGGLYMSLVVEDARFLMLDTILPLAQTGTTLHDGLSLLERQLSDGFASYFFRNYVVNEGLDVATTLVKNYLAGVCPPAALAVGLIDLANNVVFDVIFDVPSVDDFMLQTVLTHYAIDLHTITRAKLNVFEQPFSSADVVAFERLYAAYSAAVTAGLDATERLTLDENEADFAAVQEQYGDYDYEAYVNDIIETISSIEPEHRVMKYFTWKPTGTLQVEKASNTLKEGYIYEFQGAIRGDLTVSNGLLIEEDEVCVIEGDLKHTKGTLTNKGTLHVKGDMEISSGWNFSTYVSFTNYGALQVDGDFSMTYPNNGKNYDSSFFDHGTVDVRGNFSLVGPKCRYVPQSTDTLLKIGGDLYACGYSAWGGNILDIHIVLDGEEQQTVTNLAVGDLTVENKEGIVYGSDLRLYGHFDPQGDPTEQNGHLLRALGGNVSFAQGYDYGDVSIEAYIEIANDVTFHNLTMTETLTIEEGATCTVTGDMLQTEDRLLINGTLHVEGDVEISSGWNFSTYVSIENFGAIQVDGDFSMTYPNNGKNYDSSFFNHGSVEIGGDFSLIGPKCRYVSQSTDTLLKIGGDLYASSHSAWGGNILDINILLNGDTQQTVTNLSVGDLTVANEEGILYGSELRLYGHFDPQKNPTEQNGHLLRILGSNVSLAKEHDYGDVTVETSSKIANDVTFHNLTMTETLTIEEGATCTVTGDMLQTNGQLVIHGTLHVKGDLTNSYGWGYATYVSIENFGTLRVGGSLSMTYPNAGKYYSSYFYDHGTVEIGQDLVLAGPKCFFSMQNSDAELILGGECTGNSGNLRASQGTVHCIPAEQTNTLIEALEPAATTIATEKARASYESLSAWQKQYVSAYDVLTKAEDMLSTADKFSIAGSNMTLGSTLHLNFNIHQTDLSDPDGCTAVVTKMAGDEIEKTVTIPASDWTTNKKYHVVSFPLAAKEMCTTVYVEVFDKDGKVLSDNYSDSIRSYAMRALDSGTLSSQATTMMVDMLLYGAQAQLHFKHERTDLADALLTEEHRAYASEDVVCENTQLKGSNFYGSNLSLESSILLNVFFSGMKGHDVQKMYAEVSFTDLHGEDIMSIIPGSGFIRHGSPGDIYKIVVTDIKVGDARQPVTVMVYDEEGELFGSCQDSIESYVNRASTATASPLYAAIMRFAVSTHIYLTTR